MNKILVVDDNAVNVALYQQVLSQLPDNLPICFTRPAQALAWCRTELPSVAIIDYRMPHMDGVEFIRNFRQIKGAQGIPVIMLTSISSPVLWQMALDAGADEYLMKPIDKRQFLACVSRFLPAGSSVPIAARQG